VYNLAWQNQIPWMKAMRTLSEWNDVWDRKY